VIGLPSTTLLWAAGLTGAVIGALIGAAVTDGPARVMVANANAKVATLERDQARQAFAQADANSLALASAFERGNTLTRQLSSARTEASRLKKDLQHELAQNTDGRVCLHEPALRVLDRAAGLAIDLPKPAGGAASPPAALLEPMPGTLPPMPTSPVGPSPQAMPTPSAFDALMR